ncbi:MAG: hypothetical protein V1734_00250 [Nanoarchaeota archaeon]
MTNLKVFLGISIPIAIVIMVICLTNNWDTLGMISMVYAIMAGLFWKFAKHF